MGKSARTRATSHAGTDRPVRGSLGGTAASGVIGSPLRTEPAAEQAVERLAHRRRLDLAHDLRGERVGEQLLGPRPRNPPALEVEIGALVQPASAQTEWDG